MKWGWQGSVGDFVQYWFDSDTEVDVEVLDLIQKFRQREVKCCLASEQEQYRADFIRTKLHDRLDGFFFSCELGASKSSPEFFSSVLTILNVAPEEVTYLDDDQENVTVAQTVGIDAHLYTDLTGFRRLL